MWLGDPDIDAMARLCLMLNATAYTRSDSYALAPDTWSPFNSQNTAVRREVRPPVVRGAPCESRRLAGR
jgi:hypothetical protein